MKPYYDHDGITIYHADCREVLPTLKEASVDMVITDPPYLKDTMWSYEVLAKESARIVRDGGFVYAYCGAEFLPIALTSMTAELDWFWLFNIRHKVFQPRMWHKRLMVASKPVIVCTAGPINGKDIRWACTDEISERRDKSRHQWGQSIGFSLRQIQLRTGEGDLVLDPYMGAGPVARACKDLNRRYFGIEIEEKYCEAAVQRLGQEVLPFP